MKRIPTVIRLVLGVVSIAISLVLFSGPVGLFPDTKNLITQSRARFCESLAVQLSLLAAKGDFTTMRSNLEEMSRRFPDIQSTAIRDASGTLMLDVGDHLSHWANPLSYSDDTQMFVPITSGGSPWGTLEVCFQSIRSPGWQGAFEEPMIQVTLFVGAMGFLLYLGMFTRVLVQLNPSEAVPSRVRSALDTLTQGLVILDFRHRIVLANQTFCQIFEQKAEELVGHDFGKLTWQLYKSDTTFEPSRSPWQQAYASRSPVMGVVLDLKTNSNSDRIFVVNAAPVLSDQGRCQGTLISLEDITSLETAKRQLRDAMDDLHRSHEEIRQQNVELERLATTDPLTECLNRRSFFNRTDPIWKASEVENFPVSCIMVDIDHFKSVNDTHGHATGDEVLKGVSAILRGNVKTGWLVARLGGEEFCILLPKITLEETRFHAEAIRALITAQPIHGLTITASLGVSERTHGASKPSELLDQADQCLYVAKQTGRNRVICWQKSMTETKSESAAATTTARENTNVIASNSRTTSIMPRALTRRRRRH